MFGSFSGRAGGDISPCRFVVKAQANGEAVVLQAGAGADVCGISQPSTRKLALAGWDDGLAAKAGDDVNVYGPGDDECKLAVAATVAAGDLLKSDANGRGVPAAGDKDAVGARAKHAGAAGDLVLVQPVRFDRSV